MSSLIMSPEVFGLVIIGSVDWDNIPYQFNQTMVFRNTESGKFYWADDSGCSCPMPFENTTTDDLASGTKYDVLNYLAGHYGSVQAMNLIERIQAL